MQTSPSELNRILPPIEIVSNISNSNKIYDSNQKHQKTSPNGQKFGFPSERFGRMHTQNGSTTASAASDTNTIRIKVNQTNK